MIRFNNLRKTIEEENERKIIEDTNVIQDSLECITYTWESYKKNNITEEQAIERTI